jgi:hypothetical protein
MAVLQLRIKCVPNTQQHGHIKCVPNAQQHGPIKCVPNTQHMKPTLYRPTSVGLM